MNKIISLEELKKLNSVEIKLEDIEIAPGFIRG